MFFSLLLHLKRGCNLHIYAKLNTENHFLFNAFLNSYRFCMYFLADVCYLSSYFNNIYDEIYYIIFLFLVGVILVKVEEMC